jgi:hypothetical protein
VKERLSDIAAEAAVGYGSERVERTDVRFASAANADAATRSVRETPPRRLMSHARLQLRKYRVPEVSVDAADADVDAEAEATRRRAAAAAAADRTEDDNKAEADHIWIFRY